MAPPITSSSRDTKDDTQTEISEMAVTTPLHNPTEVIHHRLREQLHHARGQTASSTSWPPWTRVRAGGIAERVRAGLARVRMNGKRLGRSHARLAAVDGLGLREAADRLGVSRSTSNGGVETAHGLAW